PPRSELAIERIDLRVGSEISVEVAVRAAGDFARRADVGGPGDLMQGEGESVAHQLAGRLRHKPEHLRVIAAGAVDVAHREDGGTGQEADRGRRCRGGTIVGYGRKVVKAHL